MPSLFGASLANDLTPSILDRLTQISGDISHSVRKVTDRLTFSDETATERSSELSKGISELTKGILQVRSSVAQVAEKIEALERSQKAGQEQSTLLQ
jgi:methyl-accepting chemotaxis protein